MKISKDSGIMEMEVARKTFLSLSIKYCLHGLIETETASTEPT